MSKNSKADKKDGAAKAASVTKKGVDNEKEQYAKDLYTGRLFPK